MSKKKKDINWFTEWICRPPAAVVVSALEKTPITPNQITFASFAVCAGAAVILATLHSYLWLLIGVGLFEFSFILDCADGQLARVRGRASKIGHQLDFLMDEIKAMMMMGAVALRVAYTEMEHRYFIVGILAVFVVSAGIALTTFTRREEYGAKPPSADGQPAEVKAGKGPLGLVIFGLEWIARVFVHYPQYIWILAIADRMTWFLWVFAGVHALYFLRTYAMVFFRLGRFEAKESS